MPTTTMSFLEIFIFRSKKETFHRKAEKEKLSLFLQQQPEIVARKQVKQSTHTQSSAHLNNQIFGALLASRVLF